MRLRFAVLGSGSRGNALWVESGKSCVLIDCGFSAKETTRRLQLMDRHPEQLSAICLTHEHQDHIGGAGPLARRYQLPVFASRGTATRLKDLPDLRIIDSGFSIGALHLQPYHLSHDARAPIHYVLDNGRQRLGLLSDSGQHTRPMRAALRHCDALCIEANHDSDWLAQGDYPFTLKQRVAGPLGHLSNPQATALVDALDHDGLQHLLAIHLSEKHNSPERARAALAEGRTRSSGDVAVAEQDAPSGWFEIA